ncbi:MAG: flagellar motor protein MotB [Firmicutes bacterium]|nr:flagellar motor protein MotB [Bacillota bacterium]
MAAKKKNIIIKMGLAEWMGTYGDLVTLLLCFFVLLFSMSTVDAEKFKAVIASMSSSQVSIMSGNSGQAGIMNALGNGIVEMPMVQGDSDKESEEYKESVEELSNMSSDFKTYFAQNNLQDKIEVEMNEQYITLNFKDGILFDSGSAELKTNSLDVLSMVVEELYKYPENEIKIEGHTDNRPIHTDKYPSNWYLSAARAISVAEYFTETKNFDPTRITTVGFGEFKPKAANDTPENRSINRRVEIKILSKMYSANEL